MRHFTLSMLLITALLAPTSHVVLGQTDCSDPSCLA